MPRKAHQAGTLIMSALMLVLGIVIIVRTIIAGGGALAVGLILGVLFVIAGAGRLWVTLRGA